MSQDYYDALQPFDYIIDLLDDNKAELGVRYIAQLDEDLLPSYPAILVNMEVPVEREQHSTQVFRVVFNIDIWIFHAQLTIGKATRSRADIELATNVRKLLHSDFTLGDHIIFGFVSGEYPGRSARVVGGKVSTVVTTRLTWTGQNRVMYSDS